MSWSDPADFQLAFGDWLVHPEGRALGSVLARAITIHRNTAAKAAVDALCDNYPVLFALVGEEAFMAAGLAFVRQHPPADPRLSHYGKTFPDFIVRYAPFDGFDYLPDCGRLERAVTEALFAADAEPLEGRRFANGIDPEQVLRIHPAMRVVRCDTPAASIWRAHQPGAAETLEQLTWAPEVCLVTRPLGTVLVRALDPVAAAFLMSVSVGETLAAAAVAAAALGDLAAAFGELLAAGAFAQTAVL